MFRQVELFFLFIHNLINLTYARAITFNMIPLVFRFRYIPVILKDCEASTYYHYTVTYEPVGITLGLKYRGKQMITAYLHELGHHLDQKNVKNRNVDKNLQEKRAWKHAVKLANQYNIPFDEKIATKWLGTYGVSYSYLKRANNG